MIMINIKEKIDEFNKAAKDPENVKLVIGSIVTGVLIYLLL